MPAESTPATVPVAQPGRRWRSTWLALCLALALGACGGGGGDTAAGGDPGTSPAPQEPAVVPGVLLANGSVLRAEAGTALTASLGLLPKDSRNAITSAVVVNPTASGSPATITSDGELRWTPNSDDAATDRLDIQATDRQGTVSTVSLPVRVYLSRPVFTASLVPGTSTYADPEGAYQVTAQTSDGGPLSGTVTVRELLHRDGGRSIEARASAANVEVALTAHPRGAALPAGVLTTQADLQDMAPGMVYQDVPFGLAMGSVDRYGFNLYTTREEVYTWTIPGVQPTRTMAYLEQTRVIQVDTTCRSVSDCRDRRGAPIVLVHGFNPEVFGIGGGGGTWGNLVNELNGGVDLARHHHVFEFRWLTHLRFEEAAGRLAQLLRKVKTLTGRKPILVGHSFGGVVSHLALSGQGVVWQDGAWTAQPADGLVERLITLGSPVSGISATAGVTQTFGGQSMAFVAGRDSNDFTISKCASITCVQAGAFDILGGLRGRSIGIDWHSTLYEIDRDIDRNNPVAELAAVRADIAAARLHVQHGETINRLRTQDHSVPTYAFVGVSGYQGVAVMVDDLLRRYPTDLDLSQADVTTAGDFLISVAGQIHPADKGLLTLDAALIRSVVRQAPQTVGGQEVYPIHPVTASARRSYLFVPNMRHTQALHTNAIYGAPDAVAEPYVPVGGLVSHCPGQHWTRSGGKLVCTASTRLLMHPLLAQNLPGGLLDIAEPPLVPAATWQRTVSVTTACPPPRLCVQAEDPIAGLPLTFDVRRRSTGDRVFVSHQYSTDAAGLVQIDLDSMVGDLPAGLARADLVGRITVGDAVTYEMKTVVIDDLTADAGAPIAISLNRFALAATGSVRGTVTDRGGRPVGNAIVTLKAGSGLGPSDFAAEPASVTARSVVTDSNGGFIVSGLRATEFTVRLRGATFTQAIVPGLVVGAAGTVDRTYVVNATSCPAGLTLSGGACITSPGQTGFANPAVTEVGGNDRDALIAPNGGEVWTNGTLYTVQWRTAYITGAAVDLYVLHDAPTGLLDKTRQDIGRVINTKRWFRFAAGVANTGQWQGDAAQLAGIGNAYMVLVVSTSDRSKFDLSDATFSLNMDAPPVQPPPTAPATPTNPGPGNTSTNGALLGLGTTLHWEASAGASGYIVRLSDLTNGSTYDFQLQDQLTLAFDTSFVSAALVAGHSYQWQVAACAGGYCSAFTSPLRFRLAN